MTPEERDAHWKRMREEVERNDRAECEQLAAECPPATVGPGPLAAPPRARVPKGRLDWLANRLFGDIRIPQLRPLNWERPYWERER